MKRLVTILFALLLFVGCQSVTPQQEEHTVLITYETLNTMMKQDEAFLLYISRSDCQDCQEFDPILEAFLDEHEQITIYKIDVKAFRDAARKEDASEEEKAFFENLKTTLDYKWTPTIQYRLKDQVIEMMTYLSEDYYLIEDKNQQEQAKEENIEAIKNWLIQIAQK